MSDKRSTGSHPVTKKESFPTVAQGLTFVDQCCEPINVHEMRSASDIIVLLAPDGTPWGKYLSDNLRTFAQVSHTSLMLNVRDQQDSSAALRRVCQQAAVVILLATSELLDFMQKKSTWLAPVFKELPTTTSVVVFLLLDRQDMEDVTHNYGYVTENWKFKDPGYSTTEVQQRLAEVLDIVDINRQARRGRVQSTSSCRSSKPPVEFFPSIVYERDTRVAMVFKEEVQGEVTLKLEQMDTPLTAWRETATVFTFAAPQKPSGKYNVLVFVDNKRLRGRSELTFRGVDMASLTSPHYLMQVLRLNTMWDLDLHLKDIFSNSLPADGVLEALFRHLPDMDLADQQKNASTQYPTLLHYAASFGLSEFCAALLECPGSARAFRIRNCNGLDPAELAAENGFDELENYIIDFMEMQTAADEEYNDYMDMNQLSRLRQASNSLSDRAAEMGPVGRKHSMGSGQVPPVLPPRGETQTAPVVSPSSQRGTVHPETSTPSLAVSSQGGSTDSETYEQVFVSSSNCKVAVESGVSVEQSWAARPDRPPAPPPRRSVSQTGSSPLQTIDEDKRRAKTLPAGSTMNARTFMGMDSSGTAAKLELPSGALGSRSQTELIEVNEMVKTKEINVNQAQMFFRAWQHRYGKDHSASFKDRQRELWKMKAEYQKRAEQQEKQSHSAEPRNLLSRLGFGGRQEKHPSIKLDISKPIMSTSTRKPTQVYSRVPSTEHTSVPCADRDSIASSSGSSRDSGCSQRSRHSNVSASSEPEGEGEGDEVFSPGNPAVRPEYKQHTENRLSLGDLYLQQARNKSGSDDGASPPVPLVPTPSQTRTSSSTSTITESMAFEGTKL